MYARHGQRRRHNEINWRSHECKCHNACAESQSLTGSETKESEGNESGRDLEESRGKEVEMICACDEKE